MVELFHSNSRSARLDRVLGDLLGRAPELQAAAVVSFDGLPMASALPIGMDEDRVAAMSAALLSLGERAAENFGRGTLNQLYVEGENGTVFLVSADDEAVLVAVGARGAKVGLMMFEVRRSATSVADALRADDVAYDVAYDAATMHETPTELVYPEPVAQLADAAPVVDLADVPVEVAAEIVEVAAPVPLAVVEPEPELEPVAELLPELEPELPSVPALHVVEELLDEPDDEAVPMPEEPAFEPYSPYEEDLPQVPSSPWGNPLTGLGPVEPVRRPDPGHWTAYDQTGGDSGNWS
jgi:uncharacterized protein